MLDMWRIWPFKKKLSFKLQGANLTGGRLAKILSYIHRPRILSNSFLPSISTILCVDGHISNISTKFLIDSGAVMSVVCYEFLTGHDVQINRQATAAIGANRAPLDVIGHTQLAVSLGTFQTQYQFTVVQHLTVDCLLGADFLQDFGALLDCRSHTLTLGMETRHCIPVALGKDSLSTHSGV